MTEDDIEHLRKVGFSDVEILEIVAAACYRVYISKFADALGVGVHVANAQKTTTIGWIGLGTDCMCDVPHHDEAACLSGLCGRCHRNHCRDGRYRKLFGRHMRITTLEYFMPVHPLLPRRRCLKRELVVPP